ncbi:hypothetical protein V6N13_074577 [Hibiscus sabdariffa]
MVVSLGIPPIETSFSQMFFGIYGANVILWFLGVRWTNGAWLLHAANGWYGDAAFGGVLRDHHGSWLVVEANGMDAIKVLRNQLHKSNPFSLISYVRGLC